MKSEKIINYLKSLTLRKNRNKLAFCFALLIFFLAMVIGQNENAFATSVLVSKYI